MEINFCQVFRLKNLTQTLSDTLSPLFESRIAFRSKRELRRNGLFRNVSQGMFFYKELHTCAHVYDTRGGVTYPTERIVFQYRNRKPYHYVEATFRASRRCCIVKNCMSFQRPIQVFSNSQIVSRV